jgi:ABC-type phosphate transport system substrate-binding protein
MDMPANPVTVTYRRRRRTDLSAMVVAVLALMAFATAKAEPLAVIVNPKSGVEHMTRSEVADVFMARARTLSSGVTALPLDLAGDSPTRQQFYQLLIGKNIAQINSYWARLIFTGRATPPRQLDDAESVVATVAENKGAIAYVEKSKVDSRVRIVLEISP